MLRKFQKIIFIFISFAYSVQINGVGTGVLIYLFSSSHSLNRMILRTIRTKMAQNILRLDKYTLNLLWKSKSLRFTLFTLILLFNRLKSIFSPSLGEQDRLIFLILVLYLIHFTFELFVSKFEITCCLLILPCFSLTY